MPPRRSRTADIEKLRVELIELLNKLPPVLRSGSLRDKARALAPAFHHIRDMGSSLMPMPGRQSGRKRVLEYLRRHVGQVVHTDELMVVAGIGDYARRIRELRVEAGWPIVSGYTVSELRADLIEEGVAAEELPPPMDPHEYKLTADEPNEATARRWKIANGIRNSEGGVQDKLLRYFQANVGQQVTSEELRYVAKDATEWARRSRELRTEEGWPVTTRFSGDPTLPVGVYVLSEDKRAPAHDRHINEKTRRAVLKRDGFRCREKNCGWPDGYDRDLDRRFLEAHHLNYHANKGSNDPDNLVTLCNICHDEVHRTHHLDLAPPP